MTRKWNIAIDDQSNANYDERNEITYNTEVLKSDLCDYNDACLLVKGDISVIGHYVANNNFESFEYKTKLLRTLELMERMEF